MDLVIEHAESRPFFSCAVRDPLAISPRVRAEIPAPCEAGLRPQFRGKCVRIGLIYFIAVVPRNHVVLVPRLRRQLRTKPSQTPLGPSDSKRTRDPGFYSLKSPITLTFSALGAHTASERISHFGGKGFCSNGFRPEPVFLPLHQDSRYLARAHTQLWRSRLHLESRFPYSRGSLLPALHPQVAIFSVCMVRHGRLPSSRAVNNRMDGFCRIRRSALLICRGCRADRVPQSETQREIEAIVFRLTF